MNDLTTTEVKVIKGFFVKPFEEVAVNLSKLCSFSVDVLNIEVKLADSDIDVGVGEDDDERICLETTLLGNLPGRSFLIFRQEEAALITRTLSGEEIKNAMLMEVDNILSATVITHLSNQFNLETYGDVPSMKTTKLNETTSMINRFTPNGQLSLVCKVNFASKSERIFSPVFVWKFGHQIVKLIGAVTT